MKGPAITTRRRPNMARRITRLVTEAVEALAGRNKSVIVGSSWTTDAPFRETAEAIEAARCKGVLAVEMEAAALYAFARRPERRFSASPTSPIRWAGRNEISKKERRTARPTRWMFLKRFCETSRSNEATSITLDQGVFYLRPQWRAGCGDSEVGARSSCDRKNPRKWAFPKAVARPRHHASGGWQPCLPAQ